MFLNHSIFLTSSEVLLYSVSEVEVETYDYFLDIQHNRTFFFPIKTIPPEVDFL